MDKQQIDLYLTTNAKYFEATAIPVLRAKLERADETTFLSIQSCDLKNPNVLLIVSIFLGTFGIDRFMLGDIGIGILKLLTGGCCGILTLVDWFTISKKTKQKNLATLSMFI